MHELWLLYEHVRKTSTVPISRRRGYECRVRRHVGAHYPCLFERCLHGWRRRAELLVEQFNEVRDGTPLNLACR